MRARFLLAAVCIFSLPLWSSATLGNQSTSPTPYAAVVYAGHVVGGSAYCDCNTSGCICGDENAALNQPPQASSGQPGQSADSSAENSLSGEAGLGLFALTLFLFWLRLKN